MSAETLQTLQIAAITLACVSACSVRLIVLLLRASTKPLFDE